MTLNHKWKEIDISLPECACTPVHNCLSCTHIGIFWRENYTMKLNNATLINDLRWLKTNKILQHRIHAYIRNLHMYKRSTSYCVKKSIHFSPSHFHGNFCYWNFSSCETSHSTSIMESVVPPLPIFLSSCCMCVGRRVGCKV